MENVLCVFFFEFIHSWSIYYKAKWDSGFVHKSWRVEYRWLWDPIPLDPPLNEILLISGSRLSIISEHSLDIIESDFFPEVKFKQLGRTISGDQPSIWILLEIFPSISWFIQYRIKQCSELKKQQSHHQFWH